MMFFKRLPCPETQGLAFAADSGDKGSSSGVRRWVERVNSGHLPGRTELIVEVTQGLDATSGPFAFSDAAAVYFAGGSLRS